MKNSPNWISTVLKNAWSPTISNFHDLIIHHQIALSAIKQFIIWTHTPYVFPSANTISEHLKNHPSKANRQMFLTTLSCLFSCFNCLGIKVCTTFLWALWKQNLQTKPPSLGQNFFPHPSIKNIIYSENTLHAKNRPLPLQIAVDTPYDYQPPFQS